MLPIKEHLDKAGLGGSLFAALCCVGLPALLSVLTAVGAGFLINDAILRPLLIVFVLVFLAGLLLGWQKHRRPGALLLGGASALLLYAFIFVKYVPVVPYVGLASMLGASVWNLRAKRACTTAAGHGGCDAGATRS